MLQLEKRGGLTAVAVIIDLLTIITLIGWQTAIAAQFQTLSAINATILAAAFILFCTAVYWLKKLEPAAPETAAWLPTSLLSVTGQRILGIFFGIAIALGVGHQLGYMEAIQVVDDRVLGAGESSAFFVYGPASWLGAGLIYMLVLSSTTPPRFKIREKRYGTIAALGLAGVNAMLVCTAAELTAVLQASGILWFLLALALLLLLFLPTRLVFLSKQPQIGALFSFLAALTAAAWLVAL